MTLDNQTLIFNLDKTFNLFNLSAKQFDTDNARSFTFQFIQNNTPFSLNGINVKVGGVKPDGKKIFNDVQIIDSTNGIVELDLTSQMLAANGVLKLEFIFMKDNIRLSSYPFEITIIPSVTNFKAIESSDEFGALTKILNSADDTINDLTNKVNSAIVDVKANQIGGTNLLYKTGYPLSLTNFESNSGKIEILNSPAAPFSQQVYCIMNDQDSERLAFWKMVDFPIMDEVHVTESCYMYIDENVVSAELFCLGFDEIGNLVYAQPTAFDIKNKWFKAINTIAINDKRIKKIQFRVDNNGVTNGQKGGVYFFYPKLERGTMATDWSNGTFDYIATIDNAPNDKDCNSFIQPNSSFLWDTGLGEFKNTPLGDLAKNSAIVFEVINYGNDGRIQQEFRLTYPYNDARKWIRNYTSDANGVWSDWRPEFIGDREINSNDDFNNITNMGCYKVQNINPFTKNSPLTLDNGIDNFGLLEVYVSGVSDNHRVLQIYHPHMPNRVGHRTPVIRMSNDNSWTDWAYIGATSKDIDRLTSQIASNSSSINDLYGWVNRNIGMQYISGATSLTLQPNWSYYLDGQHVADITHIDHSAIPAGGKVYFYVASVDPLAHIVFRRSGLCNQDVRVWLPKGQDFWIVGNTDGDKIFTMMKIGDAMRFLN